MPTASFLHTLNLDGPRIIGAIRAELTGCLVVNNNHAARMANRLTLKVGVGCVLRVARSPARCARNFRTCWRPLPSRAARPYFSVLRGSDAIAGRLRRLLTLADDTAHHTGIPDTTTDPATQT